MTIGSNFSRKSRQVFIQDEHEKISFSASKGETGANQMHDADGESFMLEEMKRRTGLIVGSRVANRGLNESNDLQLSDIHQQSEQSTGNSIIVAVGKTRNTIGNAMSTIDMVQPRSFAEQDRQLILPQTDRA